MTQEEENRERKNQLKKKKRKARKSSWKRKARVKTVYKYKGGSRKESAKLRKR